MKMFEQSTVVCGGNLTFSLMQLDLLEVCSQPKVKTPPLYYNGKFLGLAGVCKTHEGYLIHHNKQSLYFFISVWSTAWLG